MIRAILLGAGLLSVAAGSWVAAQGLTPLEQLGKNLFFDNISSPPRQSCAACHSPDMGWTGPVAGINVHGGVYRGAVPERFGNRKPPSNAYATFIPVFHYDRKAKEFVGGNFWDGRATGERLGNPAADQALGPFLNPVEQNMPNPRAVCEHVAGSSYAERFVQVWGPGSLDCSDAGVETMYDRVGLSIAAYEASTEVSPFSSKFDAYWRACLDAGNDPEACGTAEGEKAVLDPLGILTDQEFDGLIEFGEYCAGCHVSTEAGPGGVPPLFSAHTFENIGVPRNPENPFYGMDDVYLDNGMPINPLGEAFVDFGLGDFLRTRREWTRLAYENDGKQKVPTLRNVDKRSGEVAKAYMHNGVFTSLKEVVHFYNTRDVLAANWPPPEVNRNVNREITEGGTPLGNLGISEEAEDATVAFLMTLSDGFVASTEGTEAGLRSSEPSHPGRPTFALRGIWPNPAQDGFSVVFSLPDARPATLAAYDVAGRKIATREVGPLGAGLHTVTLGRPGLPAGVYMVRLVRADRTLATRAIVMQ